MIDYGKLAAPQRDGSDTVALRVMAAQRWGIGALYDGPHHLLGVHVEPAGPLPRSDGMRWAPADHSNMFKLDVALRRWSKSVGVLGLLTSFTPFLADGWEPGRGCLSGHVHPRSNEGRINVFVTIDDPVGAAEGVVHEIAHQRLHCLGIDLEEHDGTLLDAPQAPPADLFSPIRRDAPRPITALLQGVYAWTFMLEIDLAAAHVDYGEDYLSRNVPKVRMGLDILEQNVRTTKAGDAFVQSFVQWGRSLVALGEDMLKLLSVAEVPVPPKEW